MNYGEQLVMEDSGLLHGAGRVYNKIKESKDLGHVGRTMMKVHRKDISLLKEMRGLANSQAVEHKIYKMIEDVEKWCSWQA